MHAKFFRIIMASLFLALLLLSVFFVSRSLQAHAAQYRLSVPSTTTQIHFGCNPGGPVPVPEQLAAMAIGGSVEHLTACGVQLVTAGYGLTALLGPVGPIIAGISVAEIQGAAALSCDGGVYIYTTRITMPPTAAAVPDC